ncbi:MAG: motility associated factor glycosyltransferase family protein [Clostridium sp.]|nr:motility associated factor glycosyltransferase family protein [Clostridium sp.]
MQKIFQENQKLLQLIDLAVSCFHSQNFDKALRNSRLIFESFSNVFPLYAEEAELLESTGMVEINVPQFNEMLMGLLNAQQDADYILLADLYELQIAPYVALIQQAIFEYIDEHEVLPFSKEYSVEFCTNGEFTLAKKVGERNHYLHSNHKPMDAAYHLAKSWYKEDKSKYIILGLGLGYHAFQLGELDETMEIVVFESEKEVITFAQKYGVKEAFLSNPRHRVVYDPNQSLLLDELSSLKENGSFVIHYPSMQLLPDSTIKKKLENYFIQYSSIENQNSLLIANFRENQVSVKSNVYELRQDWEEKTAYIVAAGPSLDYNFHELRNVDKDNSIIIAVGTVFRKMVKEQIPIDYVVISEANERVYGQIVGVEDSGIPLLLLSTAHHKFAKGYHGPTYLIYQEGYELAEEVAKNLGGFLCQVGGSVSTVAFDLAAKMGCRRIVMVGLDLAYTNNYVHALDTSRRNIADVKNLRVITDIYGKEVYTTRSMDKYREWFEEHIPKYEGIEFYNATEGGANIKGMKNVKLKEIISEKRG